LHAATSFRIVAMRQAGGCQRMKKPEKRKSETVATELRLAA